MKQIMSFNGFPDVNEEGQASSTNKVKLGTNKRQKEKLLLAAANQKVNKKKKLSIFGKIMFSRLDLWLTVQAS